MAPPLPTDWQSCALGPEHLGVEVALHVLARRHVEAGYRKLGARARRAGYVIASLVVFDRWLWREVKPRGDRRRGH